MLLLFEKRLKWTQWVIIMTFLKTDVLLSANVFETFINAYLEYYGLNSCHSFSSPGLRD